MKKKILLIIFTFIFLSVNSFDLQGEVTKDIKEKLFLLQI